MEKEIIQKISSLKEEQCHDFILNGCDTDSIMFSKVDKTPFTEEEQQSLLAELNSIFPAHLRWEHDGVYTRVVYLKSKNYILWDGKKIKYKGSSLKSSTLEPALKDFLSEIIDAILHDQNNFQEIYFKYVREVSNISDMKRWASKKTLTEKTYKSERTNETNILNAIEGTEYVEGDKVYLYFKNDKDLALVERFDGVYDHDRYYDKLFKATERFSTIMNTKALFPNFKLKKNKLLLQKVLENDPSINGLQFV